MLIVWKGAEALDALKSQSVTFPLVSLIQLESLDPMKRPLNRRLLILERLDPKYPAPQSQKRHSWDLLDILGAKGRTYSVKKGVKRASVLQSLAVQDFQSLINRPIARVTSKTVQRKRPISTLVTRGRTSRRWVRDSSNWPLLKSS